MWERWDLQALARVEDGLDRRPRAAGSRHVQLDEARPCEGKPGHRRGAVE